MVRRDKRHIMAMALAAVLLVLLSWWKHGDLGHGLPVLHERSFGPVRADGVVNAPVDGDGEAALSNIVGMYSEGFINPEVEGTMCHVSSLAPMSGGRMAAAWYSGSREGAKDVVVYLAVYDEGKWGMPSPVVSRSSARWELGQYLKKVGNAVLATDSSGRLWLFYASIVAGGWSGTSINYKVSEDEGESWSASRKLVLSPFFNLTQNVKNNAIALRDGGFLLPVYHEFLSKRSELVILHPEGSYEKARITGRGRAVQPSLIYKEGGRLGAFMRNMSKAMPRRVLYSESPDMGQSWGSLMDVALSNPNAGLDVISTGTGLVAVLNNLERGRHRLSLEHSPDGGRTWDELYVLQDSDGMEFSYPFIERGSDGIFHITYTYDRKRIKHVSFDMDWLKWRIGGSPPVDKKQQQEEKPRKPARPGRTPAAPAPQPVAPAPVAPVAQPEAPQPEAPAIQPESPAGGVINAPLQQALPEPTGDDIVQPVIVMPEGVGNSTGGGQ